MERVKIPVTVITALSAMATQTGAHRVVQGVSIPYVCGDPNLPREEDRNLRREIVKTALQALQQEVKEPQVWPLPTGFAIQTH